MKILSKYKSEIILLFFLAVNAYFIYFVFKFNQPGDNFINEIKYLAGDRSITLFPEFRVFLRPLVPALGALMSNFVLPGAALLIQDLICYFLTPFFIFYSAWLLFKDKKTALYAAIFYAGSYPYLKFTLNYMTDIVAWFFQVLSILLTLEYLSIYKTKARWANILLMVIPLVCFLGALVKESGAVGIIFFGLSILLADYKLKAKIKNLAVVGLTFLFLIIISQLFITLKFGHNFLDLFYLTKNLYIDKSYSLSKIIKKIMAIFSIGWVFVFFGFYKLFQGADKTKKIIILSLIPSSFTFLFWPYQAERLMFVAGPLLAFLAAFGVNINNQKLRYRFLEILLVIFFIIFNYSIDFLINII